MNEVLSHACLTIFLLLPPILLIIKFRKNKPAWWMVFALLLLGGWAASFGAAMFLHASIADLIAQGKEPPANWDSDGPKLLFARSGGWLLALVYALPWLGAYLLAAGVRRSRRKSPAA